MDTEVVIVYMCVCIYIYMCVYIYIYVCVCIYIYVCVYIYVYIYIYIYTHTYTHTQWNISQPLKNEILPFVTTWMDLEYIMLSEMTQRERQILYILTLFGIQKTKYRNK